MDSFPPEEFSSASDEETNEDTTVSHSQNPYLMPVAIVIAGVLIGGAVIYSNHSSPRSGASIVETPSVPDTSGINLKKWAGELGLNVTQFNSCFDSHKYAKEVEKDFNDGTALGVDGTPTTFVNGHAVKGAVPFSQFQAAIEDALKTPAPKQKSEVVGDNQPTLGDPNAPVTIVEFSDFQCPFCGQFFHDVEAQMIEKYLKTGKVKFIYRNFPLSSIHPMAESAAEAGECAYEQGKFWRYHDFVFQHQQEL